jgi:hypothetical protein
MWTRSSLVARSVDALALGPGLVDLAVLPSDEPQPLGRAPAVLDDHLGEVSADELTAELHGEAPPGLAEVELLARGVPDRRDLEPLQLELERLEPGSDDREADQAAPLEGPLLGQEGQLQPVVLDVDGLDPRGVLPRDRRRGRDVRGATGEGGQQGQGPDERGRERGALHAA